MAMATGPRTAEGLHSAAALAEADDHHHQARPHVRVRKRARDDSGDDHQPSSGSGGGGGGSGGGGSRTAVACRACRDRKTRCSGDRPTCSYCAKAQLPCEYDSSTVVALPVVGPTALPGRDGLDAWGERILSAIDGAGSGWCSSRRGGDTVTGSRDGPSSSSLLWLRDSQQQKQQQQEQEQQHVITIEGPTPVTASASILQWAGFGRDSEAIAEFRSALSAAARCRPSRPSSAPRSSGTESASYARPELHRLAGVFERIFLRVFPVVDMAALGREIAHIAEHGIAWNADSCLVLLVCALASILERDPAAAARSGGGPPVRIRSTPAARRYWNMAKKRLVWALEECGLVAAQCRLLAGLWYLYQSDADAGWQMLTSSLRVAQQHELDPEPEQSRPAHQTQVFCNIRNLALWLVCQLQSDSGHGLGAQTYSMSPPETASNGARQTEHGRPAGALEQPGLDESLLRIRQAILASSRTLHPRMSIAEISDVYANIKATQQALDDWQKRLRKSHEEGDEDETEHSAGARHPQVHREVLRRWAFETRELSLRPALYVVLHGQAFQPPGEEPRLGGSVHSVLRAFLAAEFRQLALQHRAAVHELVGVFVDDAYREEEEEDMMLVPLTTGWFMEHNCFVLALILAVLCRSEEASTSWQEAQEAGLRPGESARDGLEAVAGLLSREGVADMGAVSQARRRLLDRLCVAGD